jgi:hypothetical protein
MVLHKRINENSSKMADTLLMFKLKKEVPAYRDANIYNNTNVSGDIKIITMVPRPGQKSEKIIDMAVQKELKQTTETPGLLAEKTQETRKKKTTT